MTVALTDEDATMAVLALIDTDLVRPSSDAAPWAILDAYQQAHAALSTGEQALVAIAKTIWQANPQGASIALLGALDRDRRRAVLDVLCGYYGAM